MGDELCGCEVAQKFRFVRVCVLDADITEIRERAMKTKLYGLIVLQVLLSLTLKAQLIHEDFFGQNAWYIDVSGPPPTDLDLYWVDIKNSEAQTVRIGGIAANFTPLTNSNLISLITKIQGQNMKPIIQVSFDPALTMLPTTHPNYRSLIQQAQDAAALVAYINSTITPPIKYWIIANEPDGNPPGGFGYNGLNAADLIEDYIREYSTRMKMADGSIKIIGPELTTHYPTYNVSLGLTDATNIATNIIPYIDLFSFHTYPFGDERKPPTSNPTVFIIAPERSNVIDVLVKSTVQFTNNTPVSPLITNLSHLRARLDANGGSSVGIAITEANICTFNDVNGTNPTAGSDDLPTGNGANSFIAGQFWAEMMCVSMEQGVELFNFWSVKEGQGPNYEGNIGYLNSNPSMSGGVVGGKKSTYYHYQMVATNFFSTTTNPSTLYANSTPSTPPTNYKAYAYKNSNEIGVLILNQAQTSTSLGHFDDDFAINLNGTASSAAINISLATGVSGTYSCRIKTETSVLIKFDLSGNFISRTEYSIDDAVNNLPPKTWNNSANAYIADGNIWGSPDTGIEPYYGNPWDLPFSDDIWSRNWNGGYTDSASGGVFVGSTAHQSPDWTTNSARTPRFFVRLNIPCGPPVSGTIELYQKGATTADVYLTPNWKMIGSPAPVTNAAAGVPYVVQIDWLNMSAASQIPVSPGPGQDYCLVARFVSNDDPMFWERTTPTPGATAGNNIKFNNNIAQKNIQIVDGPNNNFVLSVGNASSLPKVVSFDFLTPTYPPSAPPFTDVGTINVDLGRTLYNQWVKGGSVGKNVIAATRERRPYCVRRKKASDRGVSPYSIYITGPTASIGNISLSPDEIHKTKVTFNYTAPDRKGATYSFDIRQFSDGGFSGAVRYLITPSDCQAVNAGSDVTICRNCSATISASPLIVGAVYTWYNNATEVLVRTGQTIRVSPHVTTTYRVQVKSPDGCIMHDAVTVTVNPKPTRRPWRWLRCLHLARASSFARRWRLFL